MKIAKIEINDALISNSGCFSKTMSQIINKNRQAPDKKPLADSVDPNETNDFFTKIVYKIIKDFPKCRTSADIFSKNFF